MADVVETGVGLGGWRGAPAPGLRDEGWSPRGRTPSRGRRVRCARPAQGFNSPGPRRPRCSGPSATTGIWGATSPRTQAHASVQASTAVAVHPDACRYRGRGPRSCWHRRVVGERGASATAGQGRPCRAGPGITGGAGTGMSRYITQTAQASRRRAGSRGGSDETSDRAYCAVLTKPEPAGADDPSHQNEHGGRNWRLCVRLICRNVQVPGVVGVGAAANSAARPRRGDSADAGMTRQPLPWGTSTMTPVPIRSWPRRAGSTLKPMPPMKGTTVRARRWSVRSC